MTAGGDRRRGRLLVAVALVAVAALAPALVAGRPANQVPVETVARSQAESLSRPTGSAWNDTVPVDVPLSSAPSSVPNASETSTEQVKVRAARTEDRLFVRLHWRDATDDGNLSQSPYEAPKVDSFADAAAVQLPVNTSVRPGIAMGSTREMVNVWYWNPDEGSQELLAAGPGTTTRFRNASVETAAAYRDDQWYVVYSRPLVVDGANRTEIRTENDVSVAFAVWNGSNMERSGRKSVSEWHTFPLGPGPAGPPYEALLWTVAGIAIVVVVVVTAQAVRET
ncbi:MAG: ethylbenzene dehydrogenase-related protein [Haloferacaceae archaeon]